jgi:Tfp pilus assembly protein PilO
MNKQQWMVVFLIIIAVLVPTWIENATSRNDSVEACERGNEQLRQPLFTFINDASHARAVQAAQSDTEAEREANLKAAENYQRIADGMIQAASEVALSSESPLVDCKKAYPAPFPLNLFGEA